MEITEAEAIQGILNVVEAKLATTEELFSQSLQLLSQITENPSEVIRTRCIQFVKENTLTD